MLTASVLYSHRSDILYQKNELLWKLQHVSHLTEASASSEDHGLNLNYEYFSLALEEPQGWVFKTDTETTQKCADFCIVNNIIKV